MSVTEDRFPKNWRRSVNSSSQLIINFLSNDIYPIIDINETDGHWWESFHSLQQILNHYQELNGAVVSVTHFFYGKST